jgi:tetraacyldisaccharide-1-P 4'-kinase
MEIKIKKDKKGEVKKSTPKKEVEQEMITESLEDINNIVMDEDIEENQLNKDLELVDIESLE